MADPSDEELSQISEVEELPTAKKIYETKMIKLISYRIQQKQLVDIEVDDINYEDLENASDAENGGSSKKKAGKRVKDDEDGEDMEDEDNNGKEEPEENKKVDTGEDLNPEAEPKPEKKPAQSQRGKQKTQKRPGTVKAQKKIKSNLNFIQRQQEFLKQKQLEIQMHEELVKNEKEKECTFQPQANRIGEEVNFEEFMKTQMDHLNKKKQFLEDKMKEKEAQNSGELQDRPKINENSKALAQKKNSKVGEQTAFARLSKKEKLLEEKGEKKAAGSSFVPEITDKAKKIVRKDPVQISLYKDALRRRDKTGEAFQMSSSDHGHPQGSSEEIKYNEEETKYMLQRFEKEFAQVYDSCLADKSVPGLSYDELANFLVQLRCLKSGATAANASSESYLIGLLWETLEQGKGGSNIDQRTRLNSLLKGILKIVPSPPETVSQDKSLRAKFYPFYVNYRFANAGLGKQKEGIEEPPRIPTLSKKSEEYAKAAREKMASKYQSQHMNIEDQWLQEKRDIEKWREDQKRLKEESEIQNTCSFKPKIIEPSKQILKDRIEEQKAILGDSGKKDKCQELYELSKSNKKSIQQKSKGESASKEKPESSEKKEGGFMDLPMQMPGEKQKNAGAGNAKAKHGKKGMKINQKAIQGSLERMEKARKERETKKMMKEKGFTNAMKDKDKAEASESMERAKEEQSKDQEPQESIGKVEQDSTGKVEQESTGKVEQESTGKVEQESTGKVEQERVPILDLKLELGEGLTEDILVYENDNLQEIVNNVSKKHGLSAEDTEKLRESLTENYQLRMKELDKGV